MQSLSEDAAPLRPDPAVVRSTLERLASDLDAVDLDAIDGEFYWRCCRTDLLLAVEKLKGALHEYRRRERGVLNEKGRSVLDAYHQLLARFQPELPNLLDRLVGNDWIRLRDGGIAHVQRKVDRPFGVGLDTESATWVGLGVVSPAWSGATVERRIRSYIGNPRIADQWGRRFDPAPPRPEGSVAVRAEFQLVAPGDDLWHLNSLFGGAPLALPHILVWVGLPLPAEGVLASLYEAVVIDDKQWNRELRGVANRQECRVALRTWAVGLLVAGGRKTNLAMAEVCALLGEPAVTQVQFTEDRLRLVERVPEAKPFLYQRSPRGH